MKTEKELLSIDLSNYCSKQCRFCYNHSSRNGNVMWTPGEVISFTTDCIRRGGIKAVSLGGGEPFEYDGIFDVIDAIWPLAYLSITSNGLPLLNSHIFNQLKEHRPDKLHLTIHNPDMDDEVTRVIGQIEEVSAHGIKPGVNLLVSARNIEESRSAYSRLLKVIGAGQIILVPLRFSFTPSAQQLSYIAGNAPFQSPSCLLGCIPPEDFISVSWDKKVNHCSYAGGSQPLESLNYSGLMSALEKVNFKCCTCTVTTP